MAEEQKDNQDSDYPEYSENTSFSYEKKILNSDSDEVPSENYSKKGNKKDSYAHPSIIVNIPKQEDGGMLNEAKRTNALTQRGMWINFALFLITLFTFYQTKRSVDLTAQVIEDSKRKDSISFVKDSTLVALSKIETRPLVQVSDIRFNENTRHLCITL